MNSWNSIGRIGSLAVGLYWFSLDRPEPLRCHEMMIAADTHQWQDVHTLQYSSVFAGWEMDTAYDGGRPSEARWRRLLAIIGIATSLAAVAAELSGYFHFLSAVDEWVTAVLNKVANVIVGRPLAPLELWLIKASAALTAIWLTCFAALRSYVERYERTSLTSWIGGLYFLDPPDEVTRATAKTAAILFIVLPAKSAYRAVCPPWYRGKFVSCHGLHIKLWLYLWEVAFTTTMLATCGMIFYFISKVAKIIP